MASYHAVYSAFHGTRGCRFQCPPRNDRESPDLGEIGLLDVFKFLDSILKLHKSYGNSYKPLDKHQNVD